MDGKNKKQKLLVLIDFTQNSYRALKYAISLAKVINGKILLLYVALPKELVNATNSPKTLQAVGVNKNKAEAQMRSIIEMIEAENLNAEYINTKGNICTKLDECTKLFQPNLIVLGKSSNSTNQLGEITTYLLYQNNNNVLIIGSDDEFREDTVISVECNENTLTNYNSSFLFWLNANTKTPLCIFVNQKNTRRKKFVFPENWGEIKNTTHKICYKTKQCFSIANSIKTHIVDKKIELMCIGRKRIKTSFWGNLLGQTNTAQQIINNSHIPVLIMRTQTKKHNA